MRSKISTFYQTNVASVIKKHSLKSLADFKSKDNYQDDSPQVNNKKDLKQAFQSIKIKQKIGNIVDKTAVRRLQKLQKENFRMLNDAAIVLQDKQSFKAENDFLLDKNDLSCLEKLDKLFPPFNPCSRIMLLWDVIQMLFSMSIIFIVPIHLIFQIDFVHLVSPYVVYTILPLSLMLDMFVNLNTACFLKGTLTNNRKIIFKNYISQDFKYDIIANIPLLIYSLSYVKTDPSEQYQIYRFATLTCFSKVYQFNRVFKRVEDEFPLSTQTSNIIQLVKLFLSIILNLHISALAWLIIGFIQIKQGATDTWMNAVNITNSDWYIQYIYSYYFSTVTMITVGYGDISPQTVEEKILSIINMMIACGQFAYSVNSIGHIFEQFFRLENEIQANMKIINRYMTNKTISKNLQYQVREYLEYYWKQEKSNHSDLELRILNQLSHKLKETLLMEANKIALRESPIFSKNFSEQVIQKTVPLIKEIRCTPEEIIYLKGDQDDFSIYFIEKGQVEAFTYQKTPFNKKMKTINSLFTIGQGSFFGEYSFFTGEPRDINIRSLEFTTLLKINRSDLITLLKDNPDDFEIFCMIRDSASFNSEKSSIMSKCYCCNEFEHSISYCPLIHNVPNKFNIIRLHSTGREQNRLKMKRKRDKKKENTYFHNYDYQVRMEDFVNDNMEEIRGYFRKYFIEMVRIDSNETILSSDMFQEDDDEDDDDYDGDLDNLEDYFEAQNQIHKRSQLSIHLPQKQNALNINTQFQNLPLSSQKIQYSTDQKNIQSANNSNRDIECQNISIDSIQKIQINSEDRSNSSIQCIQNEEKDENRNTTNNSDLQNPISLNIPNRKQSKRSTIGAKKLSRIQKRSESIYSLQKKNARGSSASMIALSVLDLIKEKNIDPLEAILELIKLNQNQSFNNPNLQLNKQTSLNSPNQQHQFIPINLPNHTHKESQTAKKQTLILEPDKNKDLFHMNMLFQNQQNQTNQEPIDDTARNYKFYYPHHNLSNIIENVLEKRRQKREEEKKKIELIFQEQLLMNVNIKPRAKSGQVKIVQIANRSQKRALNRVSSDIRKLDKFQKFMSFKLNTKNVEDDDDEDDDDSSSSSSNQTNKIEKQQQIQQSKTILNAEISEELNKAQLNKIQLESENSTNQPNDLQTNKFQKQKTIESSVNDEQHHEEDVLYEDQVQIQPIQEESVIQNSFFLTKYNKFNDACNLDTKNQLDQNSFYVSQNKSMISSQNFIQ